MSLLQLLLGEAGDVKLVPSAAEWSARRGQWQVQNTSPDWMVLLRQPLVGGVVRTRPRLVLAGDCGCFALTDLMGYLGQARWTGVLKVLGQMGERSMGIKEGEVRWAQSDAPTDKIGEILVRLGVATPVQIDKALRSVPPSKLGRQLVEKGVIQAHDLWKCLNEQVAAIFHAMLVCGDGTFLLFDQEVEDKPTHNFSVSMQNLLMDSLRKIDEMTLFRKKVPHGRVRVVQKKTSNGRLEANEDVVLGLSTGTRTILDLAVAAKLSEFDVTRAVYRLLEGGYVQLLDTGGAATPVAPVAIPAAARGAPDAAAVIDAYNAVFSEIRLEVDRHRAWDAYWTAANAALAGHGLSPQPVLAGLKFHADGRLPKTEVLSRYEALKPRLGSAPVAALHQALNDVMFFLLFQVGEMLQGRADDEGLSRRAKALLVSIEGA